MKISVIGAGNAGCITALHFAWYTRKIDGIEIELIYDPTVLPEKVGQATTTNLPGLLWRSLGFNWYHNPVHATFKAGILYEGWGKINNEIYHSFPADTVAMHYCPSELHEKILSSGYFKVTESNILDPKSVDSDYVFDCRGKPSDYSEYEELTNPTNACILGKPNWDTTQALWSRHVATPDGWTFVIPTSESSLSHDYCVGYCYNSNITKKEIAEYNFLDMFDVEVTKHINYRNYMARNLIQDGRIFLNGNRLFFLEPMESSSTQIYVEWDKYVYDCLINKLYTMEHISREMKRYVEKIKNFVLWHYQFGSKYDTPFWNYAKTLTFSDPDFDDLLRKYKDLDHPYNIVGNVSHDDYPKDRYGQWGAFSIKSWYDGMTQH